MYEPTNSMSHYLLVYTCLTVSQFAWSVHLNQPQDYSYHKVLLQITQMQQRFCATALCGKASVAPPCCRPAGAPTGLFASSPMPLVVSFFYFLTTRMALFVAVLFRILVSLYTDFCNFKVKFFKERIVNTVTIRSRNVISCKKRLLECLMENGIGFIKAHFKPNGTRSNVRFRHFKKEVRIC